MYRLSIALIALVLMLFATSSIAGPLKLFERGSCAGGVCSVPVTATVKAPDQAKPDQIKKPDQVKTAPPSKPQTPPVSAANQKETRFGKVGGALKRVFLRRH